MWTETLLWFGLDMLMLAVMMTAPLWRREEAFFGVRVSESVYLGKGRRVLHRYWLGLAAAMTAAAAASVAAAARGVDRNAAHAAGLVGFCAAATAIYVACSRRVRPHAEPPGPQRFASSLAVRRLGDYTSSEVEIAVVAAVVAPVVVLAWLYPGLPERVPIHWNLGFEPDAWADKSLAAVFGMPALAAWMQGLMLLIKHGLLRVKMTLPAEKTEEYLRLKEELLRSTLALVDAMRVLAGVLLAAIALAVAADEVAGLHGTIGRVAIVVMLLVVVTLVVYGARIWRNTRDLKAKTGRTYVQRERDEAHWYGGGLVYFNPEDPALWVEKLVGAGYTINMANELAYVYFVYLLALPALLAWVVLST